MSLFGKLQKTLVLELTAPDMAVKGGEAGKHHVNAFALRVSAV